MSLRARPAATGSGSRRGGAARRAGLAALLAGAALLGGCSSLPDLSVFWPFGSSKPKLPEPPPVTAPVPARVLWSTRLAPGGVGFAPTVAADSVFAAAADGSVARVDAASGQVRWRVNVGKAIAAGAGSDGEIVVVVTRDASLVALDAASGANRWTAPLGAEPDTVPVVGVGLVVVRSSDNRVQAFDADTGKRRWTFQRQSPPLVLHQSAAIAVAPGTAYVGLPGGRLVALGLQNGALRWEGTVAQPRGATEIERVADVVGSPLVSGRDVCAASFQGRTACFEAPTGRLLWSRDVGSSTGIDVDARLLAVVDSGDVVHAFSRNGTSLWRQDRTARRGLSAPLSLGPVLVVGDVQGLVYLLSRDNGAVAGVFSTDGTPIVVPPVAAGRAAIVQSSGGTLTAVGLD